MAWKHYLPGAILAWLLLGFAALAEPAEFRTGIFITSLSDIDPADGSFDLAAYVWFRGPGGVFNPETDLQVLARSASVTPLVQRQLPDGSHYAALRIEAEVNQEFDLHNYPFDRQTLRLLIETDADTNVLRLVPDTADSRVADFLTVPTWDIIGLRLEPSEFEYDTGFGYRTESPKFSRMAFAIDITRGRSVLLLEKFAGFVVSLILTIFIFFVPPNEIGIRVGIITSSVFAAVFNRYRLEDRIGFDTSFGLVDQVSLLTFAAVLSALAVSLRVHSLAGRRSPAEILRIDRLLGSVTLAVIAAGLALAFARALT